MQELKTILDLIRIRQWYKNVIIFLPLVFSFQFLIFDSLVDTILGCISLCLVSGATYIFNDIKDVEADRIHPGKKNRPLAKNYITKNQAIVILSIFLISGLILALILDWQFCAILFLLLINTILYSFWTKNIVFFDIFSIGLNFVLRVISGIVLLSTEFSPWVIGGVFLVALFLGFVKRKNELQVLENTASQHRKTLNAYTISSLNKILIVTSVLVITIYSMYVFIDNPTNDFRLSFTIPLVIFIVVRQLHLSNKASIKNKFSEVISDIPTLSAVLAYIAFTLFLFYFM